MEMDPKYKSVVMKALPYVAVVVVVALVVMFVF